MVTSDHWSEPVRPKRPRRRSRRNFYDDCLSETERIEQIRRPDGARRPLVKQGPNTFFFVSNIRPHVNHKHLDCDERLFYSFSAQVF